MKHLKLFSESYSEYVDELRFTREDIDNILDIFQDIVDEYNLTKHKFGTNINGQYRLFDYHYNLSIWININELMHNDKFFLDIENFKNRLNKSSTKYLAV